MPCSEQWPGQCHHLAAAYLNFQLLRLPSPGSVSEDRPLVLFHRARGDLCRKRPSASVIVPAQVSRSLPSPCLPLASVARTITPLTSRCESHPPGPASPRLQGHMPRCLQVSQFSQLDRDQRPPGWGGAGKTPQHTSQPFQDLPSPSPPAFLFSALWRGEEDESQSQFLSPRVPCRTGLSLDDLCPNPTGKVTLNI